MVKMNNMKKIGLLIFILIIGLKSFAQVNKGQSSVPDGDVVYLNDEEREIFRMEALKKIKSFQGHLSFISSKNNSSEDKKIYKEIALSNFINKGTGVTMEVSSISTITNQEVRHRLPLIQYLDNLSNLPYSRVELKTAKTCYVSNLIKSGTDQNGNPVYAATATYYQEFTGYNPEGRAVYRDITSKTVTVQVSFTTNEIAAQKWIVSLGDISISETSR